MNGKRKNEDSVKLIVKKQKTDSSTESDRACETLLELAHQESNDQSTNLNIAKNHHINSIKKINSASQIKLDLNQFNDKENNVDSNYYDANEYQNNELNNCISGAITKLNQLCSNELIVSEPNLEITNKNEFEMNKQNENDDTDIKVIDEISLKKDNNLKGESSNNVIEESKVSSNNVIKESKVSSCNVNEESKVNNLNH